MTKDFVFTSESVTEGHPDKLCDLISDAVVDAYLCEDPLASIVAECAVSTGILFISARLLSDVSIDVSETARQVIAGVGYDHGAFEAKTCSIMTSLEPLPAGAARRIDEHLLDDDDFDRFPVRDQCTVFGFACTQTPALMPLPIWLAHKLARRLAATRLRNELDYLAPDGKSQVTVQYEDGIPSRIHSIAMTAAIDSERRLREKHLERDLLETVIKPAFKGETVKPDNETRIFVNPGGPFYDGGPALHAGLTGRKTAIDTYGEYARQSGAALSGKDPSRIDRIGAYAARYAAKNIVASGLASECEVHLSYMIGLARPVSVQVETFGTGQIADELIAGRLLKHFEFRPAGIAATFDLRRQPGIRRGGFYRKLAAYGQVGRMDIGLPWENTDRAAVLTG